MNPVAPILFLAVLFLLFCGAAAFAAMVKGSSLLRRLRDTRINPTDTLLKSPLVPPISVLVAPVGDPLEGCGFVRRLLSLHYSRHEVVVVLDAPRDADLASCVREFHL